MIRQAVMMDRMKYPVRNRFRRLRSKLRIEIKSGRRVLISKELQRARNLVEVKNHRKKNGPQGTTIILELM